MFPKGDGEGEGKGAQTTQLPSHDQFPVSDCKGQRCWGLGVAHVLLAVALQQQQVWALVQGVTHGGREGLLRLLGSLR